jgi:ABC-type nitrate/sulfonate/bicarbonate transport system permease component
MKKSINTESKLVPVAFQVLLILAWQVLADMGSIPKYILPSPKDIMISLFKILPDIRIHLYTTLEEAAAGFAIAVLISIVIAVLMDNYRVVRKSLYPILVVSQTIPIIALAPLFMVWFGFGITPKVIVVVLVCFFPVAISLLDGLDSVDRDMINLLKSMGASKFQIFRYVKFPGALTSFFSGLRIAATYSIMGAIIGEWLGGEKGLGVYMIRVKHSFALDKMFAVILIIVVLSMALFGLIYMIQRLATPWDRKDKTKGEQQ